MLDVKISDILGAIGDAYGDITDIDLSLDSLDDLDDGGDVL